MAQPLKGPYRIKLFTKQTTTCRRQFSLICRAQPHCHAEPLFLRVDTRLRSGIRHSTLKQLNVWTGTERWRAFSSNIPLRQKPNKDTPSKAPVRDEKEAESSKPRLRDISQVVKQRISSITPHENIYTIPNFLTVSRLVATPVIGYLVLHDQHVWAVGLFAYAGISDLVDGWIARRWMLQTVVGSVIDPMADKFLMTVLVGCLAAKGALPLWLATVIFGRDMSLGFSAIYYRFASLPAPKTFMRYWDFSIPSAEVHPTTVSKWNTFLQLGLIGSMVTLPLLTDAVLPASLTASDMESVVEGLQYVIAATTLWSGASYLWTKDAVQILGANEELKQKQGFRGRAVLGVSFAAFLGLAIELGKRQNQSLESTKEGGV